MISHDYELEKQAHPENFEFSDDEGIEEYKEEESTVEDDVEDITGDSD